MAGGEGPGAVRELARELGGSGGAALRGAARTEARARGARAGFAREARAAAGAALGLATEPRRRALVPFGRWAFFEGEVCGAAGGLVARLADGHFAELTAPQAAALLEQRTGEAPGAWGLHLPPPSAAQGQAPGVPQGAAGGKADGPSAAPLPRPLPPAPARAPGLIPTAEASPAAEAAPAPAHAAAGPGSRAPAFHVRVREAPVVGPGGSPPAGGGGAAPAPGVAEPKLRSKFAQEFARR